MKRFRYYGVASDKESLAFAHALYRRCFGEEFPSDWRIYFHSGGSCSHENKDIHISAPEATDGIKTLIHEFIHQRHPDWWHHTKQFASLERRLLRRILKT